MRPFRNDGAPMRNPESGNGRSTVLVVDDEQKSLNLLRRTLRGAYRVLEAVDGKEGLVCLAGNRVSVVVADQRMPGMSGVEFLSESFRRFPETQRILLTGFTETEGLIEAINAGQVFGYVAKPWHPDELLVMLRRAEETYRLRRSNVRLLNGLRQRNRELRLLLEETRKLQKEKIQTERWAALGKMAGMVAHDLRSPLASIQCHAGLLQESPLSGGQAERSTGAILSEVRKMKSYIEELLQFSCKSGPEVARRPYDLPALAVSLLEAFSDRCRSRNIRLSSELTYRGSCVVNPSQIYRAMENLLANAVDAAGEGGTVLLASEDAGASGIVIRIADSGPGIPEEIRKTMFEPFVTCRKAGGTGLGLAIVEKIVLEHGGRVWEERWGLAGACFHILLPGMNKNIHETL